MSTLRERTRGVAALLLRPFTATVVDARTRDVLSAGEAWSWRAQLVMRRWPFLLASQAATALCWWLGAQHGAVLVWWNLGASDAAIIIESLTAMALINQCIRDAVVSRAVRDMAQQNLRMEQAHGEQLARIEAKLDQALTTAGQRVEAEGEAKHG